MHILVTGGCGFIGSHLCDRLVADGHAVTILDNLSTGKREQAAYGAELIVGDVAEAAQLAPLVAKAEAVIHLAAIASVALCEEKPAVGHRTNFTGTALLFEAARAKKLPIVYASSAAVYGDNQDLPLGEDAALQPLGHYGRDKRACEHYAREAWQNYGTPSVGLRFFNVYGPRQDARSPYSGVISKFAAAARMGTPVTFFGDGEQTRDFIYVGDVVRLLLAALAQAKGAEIFNGCTGTAVSLKQLAATVGEAMGRSLATHYAPARAGDIRHSCGNPLKARSGLGFTATTSLAEGLREMGAHA